MGTESSQPKSLRTDEPIQKQSEDALGRGRLVEVIAKHIISSPTNEGVVLALNAPWGAGKSSFLNMLEEKLLAPSAADGVTTEDGEDAEGSETPIVIRFNPWHYTSVEQIVRMFFGELERGLGVAAKKDKAKKAGEALRNVGTLVGVFHGGTGTAIKEVGSKVGAEASLPQLKRELDGLLAELGQRVVVFVDDLDRLERDMLRMIFKVIRLNAGFSNVTYVLSFDRVVVEASLDEDNGIRGRDYLEKIIQVSFDIPAPEPSVLNRLLFKELDTVVRLSPVRKLDDRRWGNLFHSGFKNHFRTIRQIKRYANGLRLTLPPVAREVDISDFLGVELIRVFHPEVYRELARGRELLAPESPDSRHEVSVERLREWVEGVAAKASEGFKEHVLDILRELFPELARVYRNTTYGSSFTPEWRREGRICSHDNFDKFFLLGVPSGEVSEFEIKTFLDLLADTTAARDSLRHMHQEGRARRLLERLEDYTGELTPSQSKNLIALMFEEGDSLRFESRGFMDIQAEMQVARINYQCLSRVGTVEESFEFFLELLPSRAALFTVVHEVALYNPTEDEGGTPFFTTEQWGQLRDAALVRLEDACKTGALWQVPHLTWVLYRWREWAGEERVNQAVAGFITNDADFLKFLKAFVGDGRSFSEGDKVARVHQNIDKKGIAIFLELDEVTDRLRTLAASTDNELSSPAQQVLTLMEQKSRWP